MTIKTLTKDPVSFLTLLRLHTSKLCLSTKWLLANMDDCSLVVETIADLEKVEVTTGTLHTSNFICLMLYLSAYDINALVLHTGVMTSSKKSEKDKNN